MKKIFIVLFILIVLLANTSFACDCNCDCLEKKIDAFLSSYKGKTDSINTGKTLETFIGKDIKRMVPNFNLKGDNSYSFKTYNLVGLDNTTIILKEINNTVEPVFHYLIRKFWDDGAWKEAK